MRRQYLIWTGFRRPIFTRPNLYDNTFPKRGSEDQRIGCQLIVRSIFQVLSKWFYTLVLVGRRIRDSNLIRHEFEIRHGFDIYSTWDRHEFDMYSTWIRHESDLNSRFDMNSTCIRHVFDMNSTWIRNIVDLLSILKYWRIPVAFMSNSCWTHIEFMLNSCRISCRVACCMSLI